MGRIIDSEEVAFLDVMDSVNSLRAGLYELSGSIVYYNGRPLFNTDGYNLAYNVYRLTKHANSVGAFE